jgi:hypothetical protein
MKRFYSGEKKDLNLFLLLAFFPTADDFLFPWKKDTNGTYL